MSPWEATSLVDSTHLDDPEVAQPGDVLIGRSFGHGEASSLPCRHDVFVACRWESTASGNTRLEWVEIRRATDLSMLLTTSPLIAACHARRPHRFRVSRAEIMCCLAGIRELTPSQHAAARVGASQRAWIALLARMDLITSQEMLDPREALYALMLAHALQVPLLVDRCLQEIAEECPEIVVHLPDALDGNQDCDCLDDDLVDAALSLLESSQQAHLSRLIAESDLGRKVLLQCIAGWGLGDQRHAEPETGFDSSMQPPDQFNLRTETEKELSRDSASRVVCEGSNADDDDDDEEDDGQSNHCKGRISDCELSGGMHKTIIAAGATHERRSGTQSLPETRDSSHRFEHTTSNSLGLTTSTREDANITINNLERPAGEEPQAVIESMPAVVRDGDRENVGQQVDAAAPSRQQHLTRASREEDILSWVNQWLVEHPVVADRATRGFQRRFDRRRQLLRHRGVAIAPWEPGVAEILLLSGNSDCFACDPPSRNVQDEVEDDIEENAPLSKLAAAELHHKCWSEGSDLPCFIQDLPRGVFKELQTMRHTEELQHDLPSAVPSFSGAQGNSQCKQDKTRKSTFVDPKGLGALHEFLQSLEEDMLPWRGESVSPQSSCKRLPVPECSAKGRRVADQADVGEHGQANMDQDNSSTPWASTRISARTPSSVDMATMRCRRRAAAHRRRNMEAAEAAATERHQFRFGHRDERLRRFARNESSRLKGIAETCGTNVSEALAHLYKAAIDDDGPEMRQRTPPRPQPLPT